MLKSALSVFLFCLLRRLDCKDLTVKRGGDATLECFGSKDASELMIEWKKTDLHPVVNVIVFKDETFQEDIQDDLFKGRVKLKDPNWKETKDFSVNLMYVIVNDTGRYECKAGYDGQDIKVLNTISLTVKPDLTSITAFSGGNFTLPCQNPNNDLIIAVRWSRADLEPKLVLLDQEGQFDPEDQHFSFKDRVNLQDTQRKDRDISLILKHVTDADAGTYECRVIWKGTKRMKRTDLEADPICIINLSVSRGQTGGHTEDGGKEDRVRGHFGLIAFGVICVVIAVFVISVRKTNKAR